MKVGVLVFPGTWSHQDFAHVLQDVLGCDWGYVWHKDTSVAGYDCLILPGGFAHGDYLRCGAIARFSPIMEAVVRFAKERRAGHRELQRLPDPVRGGAPARGAAAEHVAPVPLPVGAHPHRERATRRSRGGCGRGRS